MVVSAATNYAAANEPVMSWLATHRKARTQSVVDRIAAAARTVNSLPARTYRPWRLLRRRVARPVGASARWRGKARLLALIGPALAPLDAACARPAALPARHGLARRPCRRVMPIGASTGNCDRRRPRTRPSHPAACAPARCAIPADAVRPLPLGTRRQRPPADHVPRRAGRQPAQHTVQRHGDQPRVIPRFVVSLSFRRGIA